MTRALLLLLLPAPALAAGAGVAPSDGSVATGAPRPLWALWGEPAPVGAAFAELARELDRAWEERRALDNETARARVARLVAGLRPTVDVGQRDLLQRALFLAGVLEVDEAGGFDALDGAVVVDGQPLPRPWLEAVAVHPAGPAPISLDVDLFARVYDEARTSLVARGGLALDPSVEGADVRLDGTPVRGEVTLLPGTHTLSWHPPGERPVALIVAVGEGARGLPAGAMAARLADLVAVQRGEVAPDDALLRELRARVAAPAVVLSGDAPDRVVWLVDGPARWGRPAFAAGVGAGGWLWAGAYEATADACGTGEVDAPGKALVPVAIEAALDLGPWRVRGGGGAVPAVAGGGFLARAEGSCGGAPATETVAWMPWAWASLGRRVTLPAGRELEPFVRVGTTGWLAVAQAGAAARVARLGPVGVDVRVAAGAGVNSWSGDGGAVGFLGGLETAFLVGGRR